MRDAILLLIAMTSSVLGMAWLALAMRTHWKQVIPDRIFAPSVALRNQLQGIASTIVALASCLEADHASMAVLVWVMSLSLAATAVALLLAWRPRWLKLVAF